jgi:fructose-1,6-bisphosphatase/inositol monophosphatase family enzyme
MKQGSSSLAEAVSMLHADSLLGPIRAIHEEIRGAVTSACESSSLSDVSQVLEDGEGDTIYAVDRISESMLVALFEREIASHVPIVLIAEGLEGGKITLPRGSKESETVWRIIADPIDGTRSLMYQKRSAWILTGIAPNRGDKTSLADIELAVQTELPLVKQHLCDTLWAVRGTGAQGERFNRLSGERYALRLQPSKAKDLSHGFSSVTRFFAGGRDVLAAIDDEISLGALGPGREGKAQSFEDQYLSTGGQLYELLMGHDRFQADLRPLLRSLLKDRGLQNGLCCHPYDLCTELIAREIGVLISDVSGLPLRARLNLDADVSWVGYANDHIRSCVEPLLRKALIRHGLLVGSAPMAD